MPFCGGELNGLIDKESTWGAARTLSGDVKRKYQALEFVLLSAMDKKGLFVNGLLIALGL